MAADLHVQRLLADAPLWRADADDPKSNQGHSSSQFAGFQNGASDADHRNSISISAAFSPTAILSAARVAPDVFGNSTLQAGTASTWYSDMVDSFHSPFAEFLSDEFAFDPGFLASQQEFRTLLFNTAQSSAPTRAASPAPQDNGVQFNGSAKSVMLDIVSNPKRIEYLKNYLDVVAPWVCIAL